MQRHLQPRARGSRARGALRDSTSTSFAIAGPLRPRSAAGCCPARASWRAPVCSTARRPRPVRAAEPVEPERVGPGGERSSAGGWVSLRAETRARSSKHRAGDSRAPLRSHPLSSQGPEVEAFFHRGETSRRKQPLRTARMICGRDRRTWRARSRRLRFRGPTECRDARLVSRHFASTRTKPSEPSRVERGGRPHMPSAASSPASAGGLATSFPASSGGFG